MVLFARLDVPVPNQVCFGGDSLDDDWEDDWPADETPLKDRRRRNKERGQKPSNPEDRERRQREKEERKRISGRGGADAAPTGEEW